MSEGQTRVTFDRETAIWILEAVLPLAAVQAVALVVGVVYLTRRRSAGRNSADG